MRLRQQSNAEVITIDTDAPLGKGGEARVYGVVGAPGLAAKVYESDKDLSERIAKLTVMRDTPPDLPPGKDGHVSIAWPLDLLRDADDATRVTGFLMGRVHDAVQVIDLYNPQTRLRESPLFDYRYLLRAARNLSAAVRACHARGYVIGDLKHSNVLVTQTALVTLVDTDSFQVQDPRTGQIFACPVRTPDFTPPELQDKEIGRGEEGETEEQEPLIPHSGRPPAGKDTSLIPSHDLFALATLIFHLLMEGTHPFAGVYLEEGDPPPFEERIARGHFAYGNRTVPYRPNTRYAPPFDMLPPALRELFILCFEDGHDNPGLRPDARTWQIALDEAGRQLSRCAANPQHFYSNHLDACPWCLRKTTQLRGLDPFPSEQAVLEKARTQPAASKPSISAPSANGPQTSPSPAASTPSTYEIVSWLTVAGGLALLCLFVVLANNPTENRPYTMETARVEPFTPTVTPETTPTYSGSPPVTKAPATSPDAIASVAYSPDGSTIVGMGEDVLLWNAKSGQLTRRIPLRNRAFMEPDKANAFAFAPDSKTLAVSSGSAGVKLWDAATGKCRLTVPAQGDPSSPTQNDTVPLAYSPDGKLLAVGNLDWQQTPTRYVIRVIDTRTGKTVHKLDTLVTRMTSLHFAPQEDTLVSAGIDNSAWDSASRAGVDSYIESWDTRTGKQQWTQKDHAPINALVFSPDGKYLFGSGLPRRRWNAHTGKAAPMPDSYFLSQDGFAISSRQDKAVNLLATHDVEMLDTATWARKPFLSAPSTSPLTPYRAQNPPVGYTSAAFSPDGRRVVTGSYTNGVQIWDARTGKLLRALNSIPAKAHVTASGLKIIDLAQGTGKLAHFDQQVTVYYAGKFTGGVAFDSSNEIGKPVTFLLEPDGVLKGLHEGISTMRVGGKRRLILPSNLTYGKEGISYTIPRDATLTVDVELLQVKDASSH